MDVEEKEYLRIGHQLNAEQSQFFGKPCFKINKKAFIAFFQKAMVFKLDGLAHTKALNLNGAKLFDPSGKNRPMKAWVQVPYEQVMEWEDLARSAEGYVASLKK